MIPLRVMVKGFMSYRDAVTFEFDGAPLWVIVGPNGAGKSAVFDAILYALYGVHRGGGTNTKALINQQSNGLVVEFDFALGSFIFRAKRTLTQKGRPTCGIYLPTVPEPRIVVGTDKEKDFDAWVEQNIGLDEQSFTAAVLLQQGKSEALLNAQPKERHQILSQLVDISRYEALSKRAEGHQKRLEGKAESFASHLRALAPVAQEDIDARAAEIQECNSQLSAAQAKLDELARLQVHCANWERVEKERATLEQTLATAQELSTRAGQIERDAGRWQELDTVLPRLRGVLDTRQRIRGAEASIAAAVREVEMCRAERSTAAQESDALHQHYGVLERAQGESRHAKDAAQTRLTTLAPTIQELEQMERLRGHVAGYDSELARFPVKLDTELEEMEKELRELEELRSALPYLETFAKARTQWLDTQSELEKARAAAAEWSRQHAEVSQEKQALRPELIASSTRRDDAKEMWTTARTHAADAQTAWARFQQVEGGATCLYCGQPLTPAHLDDERARLATTLEEANSQVQQTHAAYESEAAHFQFLDEQAETLDRMLHRIEMEHSGATQATMRWQDECGRAENEAREAIERLAPPYLELFGEWDGDFSRVMLQPYPAADELNAQRKRTKQYDALRAQQRALTEHVGQRTRLTTLREDAMARLQVLQRSYSEEHAAQVRSEYSGAISQREEAEQQLETLAPQLSATERSRRGWDEQVKKAEREMNRADGERSAAQARHQELRRILDAQNQDLDEPWRTDGQTLDEIGLGALTAEYRALAGALSEWETLREARTLHTERVLHLTEIERTLDAIPQEAKQPRSTLDAQFEATRERKDKADRGLGDASEHKRELESRRTRRAECENQRAEAAGRAHRYKELAQLLGRDYLQRHLLQQAEAKIVQNANRTLDRISNGMMRLELRPVPSPKGKRRAKPVGIKALDLVAYNRATGQEPLPVYLLSGSQRFRVAVSLALGIGQWRGAQANDAVIIDEGFGSLDKEGRRQMVDELHGLTNVLGRILLVSHQEEFADAFSNRYVVELKDGTSRARLADRDE